MERNFNPLSQVKHLLYFVGQRWHGFTLAQAPNHRTKKEMTCDALQLRMMHLVLAMPGWPIALLSKFNLRAPGGGGSHKGLHTTILEVLLPDFPVHSVLDYKLLDSMQSSFQLYWFNPKCLDLSFPYNLVGILKIHGDWISVTRGGTMGIEQFTETNHNNWPMGTFIESTVSKTGWNRWNGRDKIFELDGDRVNVLVGAVLLTKYCSGLKL